MGIKSKINVSKIKQQAKDVGKATGLMLSAFSVIGLAWLVGHKKK